MSSYHHKVERGSPPQTSPPISLKTLNYHKCKLLSHFSPLQTTTDEHFPNSPTHYLRCQASGAFSKARSPRPHSAVSRPRAVSQGAVGGTVRRGRQPPPLQHRPEGQPGLLVSGHQLCLMEMERKDSCFSLFPRVTVTMDMNQFRVPVSCQLNIKSKLALNHSHAGTHPADSLTQAQVH